MKCARIAAMVILVGLMGALLWAIWMHWNMHGLVGWALSILGFIVAVIVSSIAGEHLVRLFKK